MLPDWSPGGAREAGSVGVGRRLDLVSAAMALGDVAQHVRADPARLAPIPKNPRLWSTGKLIHGSAVDRVATVRTVLRRR